MASKKLRLAAIEWFVIAALATQFLFIPSQLPLGFEKAKVISIWLLALVSLPLIIGKIAARADTAAAKSYLGYIVATCLLVTLATFSSLTPSTALHGNPFRLFGAFTFLAVVCCGLAIFLNSEQLRTKLVLSAQILFATTQAVFAIATAMVFFIQSGFEKTLQYVARGEYIGATFGQTNFLAATLLTGTVVAVEFPWSKTWTKLKLLTILILIIGLVLTMSRTSLVLLVVYIAAKLVAKFLKLRPRPWQVLLIVVAASTAVMYFAVRLDESRWLFWSSFAGIVGNHPLGQGLDTQLVQLFASGKLPGRIIDRAHNFPLDVALSIGVPGAIIILGLLAQAVLLSLRSHSTKLLGFVVLCFWFSGLVNTKSAYHYLELAIYLSLIFALVSNKSRT